MKEYIKIFNELVSDSANYLQFQLFYSTRSVELFKRNCRQLRAFMILKDIKLFNPGVVQQVLHHEFKDRTTRQLSYPEKTFYNHMVMLIEFHEKGQISTPARPVKDPITFCGPIGDIINSFYTINLQSCDYQRFASIVTSASFLHSLLTVIRTTLR